MERVFFETKFVTGEAGAVSGVAWPFGTPDRYGDEIMPGAFKSVIGKTLPIMFAHIAADTVGVWDSIVESAKGLEVKGRLLVQEVARAREVYAMVKEGAVRGISIGFIPKAAKTRPGGGRVFSLVDVYEASLVSVPAHPGARVTGIKAYDSDRAGALLVSIQRAREALRV